MTTRIDTVAARAKLKSRREPYWHRIAKGNYLGFRRLSADSDGTWVARAYIEHEDRQAYKALGAFDDRPEHQRFDAASEAAREWFTHLGRGGITGGATIKTVCERYVRHVRSTKGDKAADDVEARFKNYVLDDPALAALEVDKLTPSIVGQWRERLEQRPMRTGKLRTKSTLNRDMTCFRACLNLALDDALVTSDFAWRVKLRPLVNVDRRRELYLDREQRRRLIKAAPDDLAKFLTGLCVLPLRPGALAALTVGDFDKRLGTVRIRTDKANAGRSVKLPPETLKFFVGLTADKLPAAPLFARANGKPWDKDAWKDVVKAAVAAAKLPPGTTSYTLRHSVITDLAHAKVDLATISQLSGTSLRMIEANYKHLTDEVAADALATLVL